MEDINRKIGENIREIRKIRGYTRAHMADLLVDSGYKVVTSSTIARWENGEVPVPSDAMVHISRTLECTVCTLLGVLEQKSAKTQEAFREFCSLPDREQEIIVYLATEWGGDVHCLIECCLMYACLPSRIRQKVAKRIITLFESQRNDGTLGEGWQDVNYQRILEGWHVLGKSQA